MKEQPILFNDAMVRAILEGRKIQTRRVIKPQPDSEYSVGFCDYVDSGWALKEGDEKTGRCLCSEIKCPYGNPRDQLWVRESYKPQCGQKNSDVACGRYIADGEWLYGNKGDEHPGTYLVRGVTVPSIFMPRWASRIQLLVKGVRVERVQDISEADAIAEGVEPFDFGDTGSYHESWKRAHQYRDSFQELWENIYKEKPDFSWKANPLVWTIDFKRIYK